MNPTVKNCSILLLFLSFSILSNAQESTVPLEESNFSSTHDTGFAWLEDDPVVAMMDSLLAQKLFAGSCFEVDSNVLNIYGFPKDSIPVYDDLVYESRMARLNAESPFDLRYNSTVKAFIDLYAVRKPHLTARVLGLSQTFFPLFEETLDRYNLPLEFKYLAIVESALNPNAVSRSGATGLWQFMYRTGKLFDLNVTSYIDLRRDPYASTVAACEYFQFLYKMFGDWNLVLAAYNGGPGTLNRAIRRSGGKTDYWELRPWLPKETRGYVPAFIAVNYIMNYASEHNIYPVAPKYSFFEVDTVHANNEVEFWQISEMLNIPIEELEYLNPVYKRNRIPYSGDARRLILPRNKIADYMNNEMAIYTYKKQPELDSTGDMYVMEQVEKTHVVQRGQFLGLIANKYNVSVNDLETWNNLRRSTIHPGQKLVVYVQEKRVVSEDESAQKEEEKKAEKPIEHTYYTVQPGDTLWDIAKKHNGISVDELIRLNQINDTRGLKPGMKIKVSSP